MDKLDTKLVDIDFGSMNNRLQKWFEKLNIITVKGLVEYGIDNLLKINGFGRMCHTSIWCRLGELDIHYTDEYKSTSNVTSDDDTGINYLIYEMDLSHVKDWKYQVHKHLELQINLHSKNKSASSFQLIINDDFKENVICEGININQLKRLNIFLDSIFKMDKIK